MSEAEEVDRRAARIRAARTASAERRRRLGRAAVVALSFALTAGALALVFKAPDSRDLADMEPGEIRLALLLPVLVHPVVAARLGEGAPLPDEPAGDTRARWKAQTEEERQQVRLAYQQLRSLPAAERQRVRAAYARFRASPAAERRVLRARFEAFARLSAAEQQELRAAALAPEAGRD